MKQIPPKVLAVSEKEINELLQRLQDGTATIEERQDAITVMHKYQELLTFIKKAGPEWDDHVLEIEHGWRKKGNLKESR